MHLPILRSDEPLALGLESVERVDPKTVRLSLTDRCDLACVYCRPNRKDGYVERRLDVDEWRVVLDGLVKSGVERVRFTGGEPLLYPAIFDLIRMVAERPFKDTALTTNATRLADMARDLRSAGLQRLTISLDTLDGARFFRMTRGGRLQDVLAGIEAARVAGFSELKLNAVVVRGENDSELEELVHFAWARGFTPRFLEIMGVGEGARLGHQLVTTEEMRQRLLPLVLDEPAVRDPHRGPAKYLRARHNPRLRVGFISGASDTFCAGCDRLRVSSDGTIRPCLATNHGIRPAAALERRDPSAFSQAVGDAWKMKPDGRTWKGCTESSAREVSIRSIGG